MDLKEEVDPYNLDTLTTLSQYRAYQSRFPVQVTEELDNQVVEDRPSARKVQVEVGTAQ
ncbi:hypothetical protein RO3G_08220 [Rhizopus delemar RA 99-880]|uniref:Uncharacterized protein n=1 Tax=Rhizopus delemar (strain RA 99-880 / ATCC MYA-4621 / FGSC 9543 / NRRL 43880) TaxID=246409 RepID=I1C4Y5_RHIO9|nr:hypothetical protein RO3G_08220 [Rhizopus delemar RA 99-880]|eukprot:EIE83515.1 hypothetical protein RO3G_08220 [Rhizopus delemar RA 99-880]